jgi:tetratricopeptide (TPR) repeat protein
LAAGICSSAFARRTVPGRKLRTWACISPDGKYFFFARRKSGSEDIYWVDAGIIEHLRTEDLNLADMLYQSATDGGIGAVAKEYEYSRARYSKFSDFDGDILLGLSDRLLAADRTEEAVGVYGLALELHPQLGSAAPRLKLAMLEDDEGSLEELSDELRASPDPEGTLEAELNLLGYEMLRLKRTDEALRALRLCVELFPGSANAHDSYGEALMINGDKARAIESYEKSLELEPENTNAADMLERLRG